MNLSVLQNSYMSIEVAIGRCSIRASYDYIKYFGSLSCQQNTNDLQGIIFEMILPEAGEICLRDFDRQHQACAVQRLADQLDKRCASITLRYDVVNAWRMIFQQLSQWYYFDSPPIYVADVLIPLKNKK